MEQQCQRPGDWLIEGYRVERVRDGFETYWEIRETWGERRRVSTVVTLRDARDWISAQIEATRRDAV